MRTSTPPSRIRIAPSILSADFGRLAEEVRAAEEAGADWIHVDVMDGRFVPNITVGLPVVRALRRVTKVPLDVHLMIEQPERYVDAFCDAGADYVTVHVEACIPLHRTIEQIRSLGKHPGVALNPATSEEALRYSIEHVDLVLVMSVSPGFGGQSFIRSVVPKIAAIRKMIDASGRPVELGVDGGIDPTNADTVVRAGARVLVAGNAIFAQNDYSLAIGTLREAGERGATTLGGWARK